MLREEIAQYTELTGEDGWHVPIIKVGAYLDGYNKGLEANKWIPVSERLPEESLNSVIGWDAYRERCVFVQFIQGHWQITGSDESFDIQAWMPLPAPYKAEKE